MQNKTFIEHPEGGRYREVFRSTSTVTNSAGQTRTALTHIYFALEADEVSRFHRVASDEVWSLYEGEGIVLYLWDERQMAMERVELCSSGGNFCCVVEAGRWQAAMPLGGPVLVGCSVAPGFEFDDFTMIDPSGDAARSLLARHPDLSRLVGP